jgi:hypothetical protein
MFMRVAVFDPDQRVGEVSDDVVRGGLLATLKGVPGFEGAYFGVDTRSGKGISVTLWATEESLRASEAAIGELARSGGARIPDPSSIQTFEVAYRA